MNTPEGHSRATFELLWPPAFEQAARLEGWSLHSAGGCIEVDIHPIPDGRDGGRGMPDDAYRVLIQWIILTAYVCGSAMHRIAWEFEYASNRTIYDDKRVPGDGMHLVTDDETGETWWVSDWEDDNDGWPKAWPSEKRP